jgi:hypothetical protein
MRQGFTELFSNRPTPTLRHDEWRVHERGRTAGDVRHHRRPVSGPTFDDESETPARPLPILGRGPRRFRSDGDEQ